MGQALNKTGRPIFYMSELGTEYGMLPGGHAGPHVGKGADTKIAPSIFNTDRVGNDINAHWASVIGLVDDDEHHAPNARPGFFNDMDSEHKPRTPAAAAAALPALCLFAESVSRSQCWRWVTA